MPDNDSKEEVNFDLTLGLSKFIEHIPHQKYIDTLLKWIINNKDQLLSMNKQYLSEKYLKYN